jgi:sporulation protein YlmC with PRC-barrel domain
MISNMTASQLHGRRVVTQDGLVLGDVSDVVFDTRSWQIVELEVRLRRKSFEALGLEKPMLGTRTIHVTADLVAGVSDALVLKPRLADLRPSLPSLPAAEPEPEPQEPDAPPDTEVDQQRA